MPQFKFYTLLGAVVLLSWMQQSTRAQVPVSGGYASPVPVRYTGRQYHVATRGPAVQRAPLMMSHYPIPNASGWHGIHNHDYTHYDHIPPAAKTYSQTAQRQQYPYLNAPMYPTPQAGIPRKVGGTLVTNQAFAPHEMLYPHSYKAMYPPFYYKVQGDWMVTPFGVWSTEHWKLQGTVVEVKYKSSISPFSGFFPPSGR